MINVIQFSYIFSTILFIVGIRSLGSPETARRGMNLASLGMFIAIVGTLFNQKIVIYNWIIAGLLLGCLLSIPLSLWIPMTKIPQRIAFSHAGGALAACLIGVVEYLRHQQTLEFVSRGILGVEVILGALTFTGSLIVSGKLHGVLPAQPVTYKWQNATNITLLMLMLLFLGFFLVNPQTTLNFYVLMLLACLFGVCLVTPIGAADMPVVIAIFNAYGGLTSAIMGLMLGNYVQIITGALDGASGFILAMLMCKAMNRSVTNVLFGAFGKVTKDIKKVLIATDRQPKSLTIEEALQFFEQARSVVVVPGYGMAVAQAHHALREFSDKLKARGVSLKYAIHPVAGRMPGHMNVLLAEAHVPYTELVDLEEINSEFPFTDIVLVLGANDVTNPTARYLKSSPIYGMPILDVDKAKRVIVIKRSMDPGFSGVENELYFKENAWMLFGDAKDSLTQLVYGFKRSWST